MICLLSNQHLSETFFLIQQVIEGMKKQGIDQWDDIYPSKAVIEQDLMEKWAYGYIENNELCAYMAINDIPSPEYSSVQWKVAYGKSLIVHRLSVMPQKQDKGIAKQMMCFADKYAHKNGFSSIRLDAFSNNPRALKLYNGLEYSNVGTVEFRKGLFYCFEKEIK